MAYEIPIVKENINFLVNIPDPTDSGKEDFMAKYHYICGMLDAYERVHDTDMKDVEYTWENFAYAVSSRLSLAAYFALRYKQQNVPGSLTQYSNDLHKIDFQSIVEHPNEPFVFVLRKLGTQLYYTSLGFKKLFKYVESTLTTFGDVLYIGYWNGVELVDLPIGGWEDSFIKEAAAAP